MRGDSGTPGLLGTLGYNSALEPVSEMCVRRGGGRKGREGGREKEGERRERRGEEKGKGIGTVAHTPTLSTHLEFVASLQYCLHWSCRILQRLQLEGGKGGGIDEGRVTGGRLLGRVTGERLKRRGKGTGTGRVGVP